MGSLGFVMAVTLIIWLGIFAYLLYLDRTLRRIEREEEDKNDL
jgi:CcmD family protein